MMSDKNYVPCVQYCRYHHMVWNTKTRTWKAVPDDFIAELRHADFPVDLVERPCRRCHKQRGQEAVQRVL